MELELRGASPAQETISTHSETRAKFALLLMQTVVQNDAQSMTRYTPLLGATPHNIDIFSSPRGSVPVIDSIRTCESNCTTIDTFVSENSTRHAVERLCSHEPVCKNSTTCGQSSLSPSNTIIFSERKISNRASITLSSFENITASCTVQSEALPHDATGPEHPTTLPSSRNEVVYSHKQDTPAKPSFDRAKIPLASTYADATNLAARFPEYASDILVLPLLNAPVHKSSGETKSCNRPLLKKPRVPSQRLPRGEGPAHTASRPNWALAPDVDELHDSYPEVRGNERQDDMDIDDSWTRVRSSREESIRDLSADDEPSVQEETQGSSTNVSLELSGREQDTRSSFSQLPSPREAFHHALLLPHAPVVVHDSSLNTLSPWNIDHGAAAGGLCANRGQSKPVLSAEESICAELFRRVPNIPIERDEGTLNPIIGCAIKNGTAEKSNMQMQRGVEHNYQTCLDLEQGFSPRPREHFVHTFSDLSLGGPRFSAKENAVGRGDFGTKNIQSLGIWAAESSELYGRGMTFDGRSAATETFGFSDTKSQTSPEFGNMLHATVRNLVEPGSIHVSINREVKRTSTMHARVEIPTMQNPRCGEINLSSGHIGLEGPVKRVTSKMLGHRHNKCSDMQISTGDQWRGCEGKAMER